MSTTRHAPVIGCLRPQGVRSRMALRWSSWATSRRAPSERPVPDQAHRVLPDALHRLLALLLGRDQLRVLVEHQHELHGVILLSMALSLHPYDTATSLDRQPDVTRARSSLGRSPADPAECKSA